MFSFSMSRIPTSMPPSRLIHDLNGLSRIFIFFICYTLPAYPSQVMHHQHPCLSTWFSVDLGNRPWEEMQKSLELECYCTTTKRWVLWVFVNPRLLKQMIYAHLPFPLLSFSSSSLFSSYPGFSPNVALDFFPTCANCFLSPIVTAKTKKKNRKKKNTEAIKLLNKQTKKPPCDWLLTDLNRKRKEKKKKRW